MNRIHSFFAVSVIALAAGFAAPTIAHAADRSFTLTAVQIDGTKFWLPSTITVKKGDHVKITAVSKIPGKNSVHGISIPAYNIKEVADQKGKTIEFTADKAGVFPIKCQLHATHVGSELVVLE